MRTWKGAHVTGDGLCALVAGWVKNGGEANSLRVEPRNGHVEAFTKEQAATLKRLAAQL